MVRNARPDPYRDLTEDDWWHPEALDAHADEVLSAAQRRRFRERGFVVVENLWPNDLLQRAVDEATALHPVERVVSAARQGSRAGRFSEMPWFRGEERAADAALNQMSLHPRAMAAAASLIECEPIELRLSQSHVIAKYGQPIASADDDGDVSIEGDQDIHVDYGNNTLLVPPKTRAPEAVACLCYYSDVDEVGGATHFCPAEAGELTSYDSASFNPPNFVAGTTNGSAATTVGPRAPERVAARYRGEKPIRFRPGVCVLYRLDAWHRGTPVAFERVRHTHHHVWRHRAAEWISWQSFSWPMASIPTRYLAELSVSQRAALGFAAPGDPYWTDETLDAVSQRYPEMDMTPYRVAAPHRG